MTKILFISYDSLQNPYYGGGGAKAVHQIASRLNRRFQIQVVCGRFPGCRDGLFDGVYYRHLEWIPLGPKLGQALFQFLLPWYLSKFDFDVVLESFAPPFTTALLPLFTAKPVIALVHMLPAADLIRKYHIPFIPGFWESLSLRIYRHFIVFSQKAADRIATANPKGQIRIIPNGVNMPKSVSSVNPKHLLFVGRLEYNQKGLDLLLTAFSQASTPLPLVIAGSGRPSDVHRLIRHIRKLGLASRVTLVGRVGGKVLDRLFRQAFCVVVPSRFETFSLVSLEAAAFGKPVVAFDIEGLRWLPSSVCLKAPPFDSQILARHINTLSSQNQLCQTMSAAARKFARQFTWSAAAEKYAQFIREVTPDYASIS